MADGRDSEDHAITSAQIESMFFKYSTTVNTLFSVIAFKRVFHHCDTYCRGTINTDDLLSKIISAENELAQQEIDDIVHVLKRIGIVYLQIGWLNSVNSLTGSNKDISFEKFIKFMLSAEKCLTNDSADKAQRLCNVLLKNRRKSIVSSIDQDT